MLPSLEQLNLLSGKAADIDKEAAIPISKAYLPTMRGLTALQLKFLRRHGKLGRNSAKHLVDNPEALAVSALGSLFGAPLPFPTGAPTAAAYLAGKKGLKHVISKRAPKTASTEDKIVLSVAPGGDPDRQGEHTRYDAHIGGVNAGFLVVGNSKVNPYPGTRVRAFYVAPEFRRQGVGGQLMRHALKTYKGTKMELKPDPYNEYNGQPPPQDMAQLQKMYRGFGFRKSPKHQDLMVRTAQDKISAADQPEEAPEGKCWAVRWADGRAIVCFRHREHAKKWHASGLGHSWFEAVGDGPKLIEVKKPKKGNKWRVHKTAIDDFECSGDDCKHKSHGKSKEASSNGDYSYGCTMIKLPKAAAAKLRAFSAEIPDDDLYLEDGESDADSGFGREDDMHITVKYGLHTSDVRKVRKVLKDVAPVMATLGKTSMFENEDYDVLKVGVTGASLHALNKKISTELKVTDTYPDYKPHATIAYLKPGRGKKYVGKDDFKGTVMTFDAVEFSDKGDKKYMIPLTKSERPAVKTGAKWDRLLRTGKLNPKNLMRLLKSSPDYRDNYREGSQQVGDMSNALLHAMDLTKKQLKRRSLPRWSGDPIYRHKEVIDDAAAESTFKLRRMLQGVSGGIDPARTVYGGLGGNQFNKLMGSQSGRKLPRPWTGIQRRSGAYAPRDGSNNSAWGGRRGAGYNSLLNSIQGAKGRPAVQRHEMGHWAHRLLQEGSPKKINYRVKPQAGSTLPTTENEKGLRLLLMKLKHTAPTLFNSYRRDSRESPLLVGSLLDEPIAQYLGARGSGHGARALRSATSKGYTSEAANRAMTRFNDPALKSTIEHMERNYGIPGGSLTRTKLSSADDVISLQFLDATTHAKKAAIAVEMADNPTSRRIGLSKHAELPPGRGMLFDKAGAYWMKGVDFPLDIVFLDKAGCVLEKQHMPMVEEFSADMPLYVSNMKTAEHALELPAGWYDEQGIDIGDRLCLSSEGTGQSD